jgi:predicted AAA+ superfamily ATPase
MLKYRKSELYNCFCYDNISSKKRERIIMLERYTWKDIELWKQRNNASGLLVTGARQVGKTFLVREFGKANYENIAEVNLIENKKAADILDSAENAEDFFARLSIIVNTELKSGKTLIFIDEVQECKEIITAIKFLVERYDFDFILSGSLLGVELRDIRSVPVGYLDIIEMKPLSFSEFLLARKISKDIITIIVNKLQTRTPIPEYLHEMLMKYFYEYLIIGGMPAAVADFINFNDLRSVRRIQKNITSLYRWDISKYQKDSSLLIKNMYDIIPSELNQQNKRFILNNVNEKARFSRYADSLIWLSDAGVAYPVFCVDEPTYPLKLSSSTNLFKLFLSDVGLLTSTFLKSSTLDILAKNPNINYGSIYENAVAQELSTAGFELYYYRSKKRGELDFIIEGSQGNIMPIEVKSGKNYKRHNALTNLLSTSNYQLDEGFVLCDLNIHRNGKITYLPIYMTGFLSELS